MVDIDELERLLAAATPGEWVTGCGFERNYLYGGGEHLACIGGRGDYEINDDGSPNEADNNADLIATLKCSAPAMIAAIRELRAENARLRLKWAELHNTCNVVGSPYDEALQAVDRLVSHVRTFARAKVMLRLFEVKRDEREVVE